MNMKSFLVAVPLFIASPVLAQPPVDTLVGMETMLRAWGDAHVKQDAHAAAGFFTEDAVRIGPRGIVTGRDAIEKAIQAGFESFNDEGGSVEPTLITLNDNTIARMGTWRGVYHTTQGETLHMKGYWSAILVRDGDTWKVREETFNVSPPGK
jgi:uncharacterized protein (TIGR02246 family)